VKKQPTPAPEAGLSNGLRRFLYATAAVTGATVMIVEILGAKMLSPYFGLSHFVWTAQIAVTLVALACGYYLGGRMADRSQQLAKLYRAILGAAAYLALTVLICEPVSYWALEYNLALGSLMASAVLFFIPLALLAMTGPFLVRVITSSIAGVGSNVGRLSSVSTLGSFAGTLLIGYLMIPLLPNSVTMYLAALVLTLVGGSYFLFFRGPGLVSVGLLVAFTGAAGAVLAQMQKTQYEHVVERFRGNSHFGKLQVIDTADGYCRYYLNDNLIQNTYDPTNHQSESSFTYLLSGLARAYTSNITDVLCIGLGVGIVPMDFARQGAKVDVVEINPAVVPVARQFFHLEPERLNLTLDDARHFLNRCHKQYDVVVLDAFLGDSSPSHLLTRQAFAAMHRVLRPGGTLVINCFGELEPGRDFFTASMHKTLKSVFQGVRIHTSGNGGIFFAAMDRAEPSFAHAPDFTQIHPAALHDTQTAFSRLVDTLPESGRVLTDDYNPVEFYDAHNRENIRRHLAMAVKRM
jgi:spermidine synthase